MPRSFTATLPDKRHPECPSFFQYPSESWEKHPDRWFDRKPLGKNTLGNMMVTISAKAGLPVVYTNHCIRATAITKLAHAGVQHNEIVSITGHKSVESLRQYVQAPSQTKKQQMSAILHSKSEVAATPTVSAASHLPSLLPVLMPTPTTLAMVPSEPPSVPVPRPRLPPWQATAVTTAAQPALAASQSLGEVIRASLWLQTVVRMIKDAESIPLRLLPNQ